LFAAVSNSECSPVPGASDGQQDVDGSIMFAIRNQGAFRGSLLGREFVPIHVSSCCEASRAHVLRSFESAHVDPGVFNEIVTILNVQTPPVLMDSQAKYALIAQGQADLLIRVPATRQYREKLWDHAAGTILVEEAGGCVTDLHGVPLDFAAGHVLARNDGVIASNGHLHAAALNAVASRGDHAVGA
jgi:3'(2'), 5'-bisphosphate nucleotidase